MAEVLEYNMVWYDVTFFDLTMLCRAVGLFGFALYVIGFFCLCTGRLTSATPRYFIVNLCAASCVMVSLAADFNLSSALIQTFYIIMSLGGIMLRAGSQRQSGKHLVEPDLKFSRNLR
ncbi:MAG: hypothetical protein AAGA97_05790 [Pseudomonadota bacterium]